LAVAIWFLVIQIFIYLLLSRENPLLRKFLILIFFASFGIGPSREGAKVILLRKGFSKEALATANLLIIPLTLIFLAVGSYLGKFKKEFTCYIMYRLKIIKKLIQVVLLVLWLRRDD